MTAIYSVELTNRRLPILVDQSQTILCKGPFAPTFNLAVKAFLKQFEIAAKDPITDNPEKCDNTIQRVRSLCNDYFWLNEQYADLTRSDNIFSLTVPIEITNVIEFNLRFHRAEYVGDING